MIAIPEKYIAYGRKGHTFHYDIAVIELKRSIQTDCWNIRAVCLQKDPSFIPPFSDSEECILAGWGRVKYALQYCEITSKEFLGAPDYWFWSIGQFRTPRGPHRCSGIFGDSGSGLVCRKESQWKLAGVYVGLGKIFDLFISPQVHMRWLNQVIQGKQLGITVIQTSYRNIINNFRGIINSSFKR